MSLVASVRPGKGERTMKGFQLGLRNRRGGTMPLAVISLTVLLITLGLEMDSGRLCVSRHKDQVIADACVFAALTQLGTSTAASDAAIQQVVNDYKDRTSPNFYNSTVRVEWSYPRSTAVRVVVTEDVPMFLSALMGAATRRTSATAQGSVHGTPSMTGVVPLGLQYDVDYGFPQPGQMASPNEVLLKLGAGDTKSVAGDYFALDLDKKGGGAADWMPWLKLGYDGRLGVGDTIWSEPGNKVSGVTKAILGDHSNPDARFLRAGVDPYANDQWYDFHPGNPRMVIVPLVDWIGADKGGKVYLQLKGFAAFYITRAGDDSKGEIYGHFVRYTTADDGSGDLTDNPWNQGVVTTHLDL
jgi:Flp pilus assembly protein TadG